MYWHSRSQDKEPQFPTEAARKRYHEAQEHYAHEKPRALSPIRRLAIKKMRFQGRRPILVAEARAIRDLMEKTNQPEAMNIAKGKWHCFDIPFTIVCGDMETATKIFNSVKDRSSECKERLQFSLSGGK